MNGSEHEIQRGKRALKAAEALLADLRLEQMTLCDRIEADALPEQGVATTDEIREALRLAYEEVD